MYVHGQTTKRPATEADLAQARHHNAQLAAELRRLEAIGERLEAAVAEKRAALDAEHAAARKELSRAREALTKTIKEIDTVRLQASRIRDAAVYLTGLPEPLYGGREGLEAATGEMIAYEARKKAGAPVAVLPKRAVHPRAEREYRHGSRNRYRAGCRCVSCRTWKAEDNTTHRKQAAA